MDKARPPRFLLITIRLNLMCSFGDLRMELSSCSGFRVRPSRTIGRPKRKPTHVVLHFRRDFSELQALIIHPRADGEVGICANH